MRHGTPHNRDTQAGFGLLEVVIASVILMIVLGTVGLALASQMNVNRGNKNRVVAANISSERVDELRTQSLKDFTGIPIGTTLTSRPVGGVAYAVKQEVDWVAASAAGSPCEVPPSAGAGGGLAYVRVRVSVSWPNMSGTNPVAAETLITPPVKTFAANTGHIPVQVVSGSGGPQPGVAVTVLAPNGTTYTQTTTAEGCTLFAFLPILTGNQTYTVSLSKPGFVDPNGVSNPFSPATVADGATAPPLEFAFDEAGSLDLSLAGVDSSGAVDTNVPLPVTPLAITLVNTGLTGQRKTIAPGSNPRTIPNLFPFADGYTALPGSCDDNDQLRDPAIVPPPGGVQTGVVRMATVRIRVKDVDGSNSGPEVGKMVRAIHDPSGCVGGTNIALAVTDANGEITVALPFGTWTIQVDEQVTPNGDPWPTITVEPPFEVKDYEIEVH